MHTITGKTVLVTGANRGIGRALLEEALNRGAKRVYAGTRQPFDHPDGRVTAVTLDVTDAGQIAQAAKTVGELDVLVNNAGEVTFDDLSDRAVLEKMFAVNFFGVYDTIQAFLPALIRSQGAIINNISVNAFAPFPLVSSYSAAKAAAFNLSQSLRGLLAGKGVGVHAVMTGLVDTDMTKGFDVMAKAAPEHVAKNVYDGLEKGEEEIFPDAMAEPLADSWRSGGGKNLERQYAQMAAQIAAAQSA
ncbi:SDR family NAD(P)-dependent oxidoreductase [Solwaraspora sp. WMMA2065]|uniref:SDR family NAD(P)-dependent oxidoreductase n=1 Tax=Solwaraspora sp. WMMA2065 TaxID=3015166 RepID=UPI00259B8115|nr:SDR family NAD(P)-dependent oxidoreductase [Solwaraspora sp. WMMA2065]WJK37454.1 SDR family NAD(P)-dependent oxidoreductase [Solwaraspora sp. WMMA2065]